MCGICGGIDLSGNPISVEEIRAMNNLASHRGPDGEGYFFKNNIAFGHRRLAILDLSEKGKQPFIYQTPAGKQLVIVCNGEIYNYLELRKELGQAGYLFHSQTDTEVILAAYDYWGTDCVKQFNGMWAFALYDEQESRLFCSRDRFGIKPFYHTKIGSRFCFASEIKQFSALKEWAPAMNRTRVWEFLNFGYHDHTAETLFGGIQQLAPATNLVINTVTGNAISVNYYMQGESVEKIDFSTEADPASSFLQLFTDTVRLHLRSDVKTGTSLSGGLDSSAVVATIHCIKKELEQSTISAVFPGYEKDESQYVDVLCKSLHLNYSKVMPLFTNLTENLEKLVWHQDEPFSSASILAQFMVYQRATQDGLKVMLDGQGADEILGGYDKFYAPYFKNLAKKNPFAALRNLYIVLSSQPSVRTTLRQRAAARNAGFNITHSSFQPDGQALFHRSTDDTVRNCSINLLSEVGLPMLLRYQDRNSMAFSVESRVPFLDHRLVEFCLALPDEWKIRNGVRKYLLRKAMEHKLPRKIVDRKNKYAFDVPEVEWIRKNPGWFRTQLTEAADAHPRVLNRSILDYLDAFINEKQSDFSPIWRVITFHWWVKIFSIDTSC